MPESRLSPADEAEQLLLNAELRDDLEPFWDESITRLNINAVPTPVENAYLASMLAWERAPVLPIAEWFDPPLRLPNPDAISEGELHTLLWKTVRNLFEKRIVLDFTDHLTDRELYQLIARDILTSQEKKIDNPNNSLHWDCADTAGDPQIWLRYYASDEERIWWQEQTGKPLPKKCDPPHPRRMPRIPL